MKTSSKTASLYSWRKRHHHLKETSNSREQCSPHRHRSEAEGLCLYPSTKIHYCHAEPRQAPGMRSWVCRRKASKTHWCDWMVSQLGGFYDCFCQAYWAVLSLSNLTQLQLVTTPIPTHAGGRSAPSGPASAHLLVFSRSCSTSASLQQDSGITHSWQHSQLPGSKPSAHPAQGTRSGPQGWRRVSPARRQRRCPCTQSCCSDTVTNIAGKRSNLLLTLKGKQKCDSSWHKFYLCRTNSNNNFWAFVRD